MSKQNLETLAAILEVKGYAANRLDAILTANSLVTALNSFDQTVAVNAANLIERLGFVAGE